MQAWGAEGVFAPPPLGPERSSRVDLATRGTPSRASPTRLSTRSTNPLKHIHKTASARFAWLDLKTAGRISRIGLIVISLSAVKPYNTHQLTISCRPPAGKSIMSLRLIVALGLTPEAEAITDCTVLRTGTLNRICTPSTPTAIPSSA